MIEDFIHPAHSYQEWCLSSKKQDFSLDIAHNYLCVCQCGYQQWVSDYFTKSSNPFTFSLSQQLNLKLAALPSNCQKRLIKGFKLLKKQAASEAGPDCWFYMVHTLSPLSITYILKVVIWGLFMCREGNLMVRQKLVFTNEWSGTQYGIHNVTQPVRACHSRLLSFISSWFLHFSRSQKYQSTKKKIKINRIPFIWHLILFLKPFHVYYKSTLAHK